MSRIRPSLAGVRGLFLAGAIPVVLLLALQSPLATAKPHQILEFDTMVGVPQALTGATNAIRNVPGGGFPWTVASARGELSTSGHLEIRVRGLVFASGPNVGRNTVTSFRAIVSCLDSNGAVVNVSTAGFPATIGLASDGGGNADIEEDLVLPQPCIAPLVFVTSPGLSWFASTGG